MTAAARSALWRCSATGFLSKNMYKSLCTKFYSATTRMVKKKHNYDIYFDMTELYHSCERMWRSILLYACKMAVCDKYVRPCAGS